jgi:hypothetical protein
MAASTTYVNVDNLNGLFKTVYASEINNLIPDNAKLVKMIAFKTSERIGDHYEQPVVVTAEHGVTYAAPRAGAFALNGHIAMTTVQAKVEGYQMLLRSAIAYETAARSVGSKAAFIAGTELVIENMLNSITKRLEIACIYGQNGLGLISGYTNSSATKTVLSFQTGQWAAGIWVGTENAQLNFYNSTSLVSTAADSIFVVDSCDVDAKTLTVTGTSTGITALESAIAAQLTSPYFYGSYGNEMAGIKKIITNTGTLFNISAATYNLWKGNSYNAAGALTMTKVLKAMSLPVSKGLDEDVILLLNPRVWGELNAELSGNRRFDGSYKKEIGSGGFEAIKYYAQNGMIEVIAHPCVMEGEAFAFPKSRVSRIGSTDITFRNMGKGEDFFLELASNAGFELRAYTEQAIFCDKPNTTLRIYGITVS